MLTSPARVLMMTGPGLALFYSGLVRRKNVLGAMMQSFVSMGVVTILWAIAGYSMAFGAWHPFLGRAQYLFLNNVRRGSQSRLRGDHCPPDLHDL
jgi:Amt family ammonium transporter